MADAPGRYLSFDPVAEEYDQTRVIPLPQIKAVTGILSAEARLERGGLFLDAGIGTGRFAVPLARRHPGQIVGADIAPAMLKQVQGKTPRSLSLAQADLQRLPFRSGVFSGALLVHILTLIERWTLALTEVRRVLAPGAVLFLGREQGARSLLIDFYYERARARHVLTPNLGTTGMAQTLAFLRRHVGDGGLGAQVRQLETAGLTWQRVVPVRDTLEALSLRTYSQMWAIPDAVHQELLAETNRYAAQTFPRPNAAETLRSRFIIHAAQWP